MTNYEFEQGEEARIEDALALQKKLTAAGIFSDLLPSEPSCFACLELSSTLGLCIHARGIYSFTTITPNSDPDKEAFDFGDEIIGSDAVIAKILTLPHKKI